ncbi:MAG: histidine phosphatase family protein [Desulfovibrio sp.]|nr:histidine phosphatase family protein [Desulfovibrio sp.]
MRHGALPPNPLRRMVGARDIPMSDVGRAQVQRLSRVFMPKVYKGLAAVVASDLCRCRETAALLLEACPTPPPLHIDDGLRELSLGHWEGYNRSEICRRWPGAHTLRGLDLTTFVPPGGESFRMAQRRALFTLARWRQRYPDGTLLFVTHAGIMRALLAHWLALPLSDALRIRLSYACRCFLPDW